MKAVMFFLVSLSTILSASAKEKKSISWFEPGFGKPGTQVILAVKGFETEDKSIAVFFGNKEAHILKKTSDHLIVSVPEGSSDGPITIKYESGQVSSESIFLTGVKPSHLVLVPLDNPVNQVTTKIALEKSGVTVNKKRDLPKDSAVLALPIATRKVRQLVKKQKAIIPRTTSKALTTTDVATTANTSPETSRTSSQTATHKDETSKTVAAIPVKAGTTSFSNPALSAADNTAKPDHTVDNGKVPLPRNPERPLILGFDPKTGPVGTIIKISGLNFGFDKNSVSVNLKNGVSLLVNSVYDQIIEVTIPAGTHQSGSLVVIVNGKKSVSHDSFKMP